MNVKITSISALTAAPSNSKARPCSTIKMPPSNNNNTLNNIIKLDIRVHTCFLYVKCSIFEIICRTSLKIYYFSLAVPFEPHAKLYMSLGPSK